MMRHEPGVVWSLRADRRDYVRTTEPYGGVPAGVFLRVGGVSMKMSRMDARLLARRINELLEKTAS